ncbi:MAG: DUF465 domain-containing protein [Venatoribacter sp.]
MRDFLQENPEQAEEIRSLMLKDRHFSRLLEEYQQINQQIKALAQQNTDLEQLDELKIRRLYIKDRLLNKLED